MQNHTDQTNAFIITIGEEIVSGLITDTNSAWLANHLYELGIEVLEKMSVKDIEEDITRAIDYAFKRTNLIFMTGGLGPTKDDITKGALMHYFDTGSTYSQETMDWIEHVLGRFGIEPTQAHRDQAYMPEAAVLLKNEMGTAPGMFFETNGKMLFSLPGVPYEMRHIYKERIRPILEDKLTLQPIFHRILMTSGQGETRLAKMFEDIADDLPAGVSIAYLPGTAQVRIRISGRGPNADQTKESVLQVADQIEGRIQRYLFGYDNEPLQSAIGRMLKDRQKTLSTAESCTGGYLAHLITSISGSSSYFMGSVIAYDNNVKMDHLHVNESTLIEHGAVSEQTVTEMAKNARNVLKTDYALATSGIAGPDGGTPDKPVGTIWIACAGPDGVKTRLLKLTKDRMRNIQYTAVSCMTLLRNVILKSEMY